MTRFTTLFRSLAAGSALAALATTAAAQTTQQQCFTATVPLQSTNWNTTMTFPKFDPALGTLQQIDFTLSGNVQGTARAESLDASPTVVTTNFQAQITLTRPDMSVIVVTIPIATFMDSFTAFDGTIDFGGTSGATHANITANASNTATSPPPITDLALFTGLPNNPGTISLPVLAAGTSNASGSGNVITQFTTMADASCTVCYTYVVNNQPFFPVCVQNQMASVGVPFTMQVCAADTDPGDVVTLTVTGLPAGATLTPPLPASGNPICTTMNWTPGPAQVGTFTIIFTATDSFGAFATCPVTLLVAECHQLFGLHGGNNQYNLFGHVYSTHIGSLTQFFPVTLDDIPNFRVPHGHSVGGLEFYPTPFYVQVVMYNPQMFPTNPEQWSRALRVQPNSDGSISTSYFGQGNGIGIRGRTYTGPNGEPRMEFPFNIFGMP
jgi:hypothetical protein